MKKLLKTICLFSVFLSAYHQSIAQISPTYAIGGSYYTDGNNTAAMMTAALQFPLFELQEEAVISIKGLLGVGFMVAERQFAIDLPIIVNYNYGHGSTSFSAKTFGFFAGIGYDLLTAIEPYDDLLEPETGARGIIVDGGIRYLLAFKHSVGLRTSYLFDTQADKGNNTFSIGLFYTYLLIQ